jgi:hypothetical protein
MLATLTACLIVYYYYCYLFFLGLGSSVHVNSFHRVGYFHAHTEPGK